MYKKLALCILGSMITQIAYTKTTYIFAHGLGGDNQQARHYKKTTNGNLYLLQNTVTSFDFPDAQKRNMGASSLAQAPEIACLVDAHNKHTKKNGADDVVWLGVSRGASTLATAMAQYNFEMVKALVMESPFACIANNQSSKQKQQRVRSQFPNFDINGVHPIDVMHKIRKDVPILIVCSKHDTLVSPESSIALYKKLIESGHKKSYLLLLERGRHANILWGNEGTVYRNVVHAFYKEHGLQYDATFAQQGAGRLAKSQPSVDELKKLGY